MKTNTQVCVSQNEPNTLIAARTQVSKGLLLLAIMNLCLPHPHLKAAEQEASDVSTPKHRIAVASFTANDTLMEESRNQDIGGKVSAMLASALEATGKFIMVGGENQAKTCSDTAPAGKRATGAESGKKGGNLVGAQMVIVGRTTLSNDPDEGGVFKLDLKGNKNIPFVGGLTPKLSSGTFTIECKILDATSGEVIEMFTQTQKLQKKGVDIDVEFKFLSLGGNLSKCSLGRAMGKAVQDLASRIAAKTENVKWTARVIDCDGGEVSVNAGSTAGISVGTMLAVIRKGKELRDPYSGTVLGVRRQTLGRLVVKEVAENYSVCTFASDQADATPKSGDLVEAL